MGNAPPRAARAADDMATTPANNRHRHMAHGTAHRHRHRPSYPPAGRGGRQAAPGGRFPFYRGSTFRGLAGWLEARDAITTASTLSLPLPLLLPNTEPVMWFKNKKDDDKLIYVRHLDDGANTDQYLRRKNTVQLSEQLQLVGCKALSCRRGHRATVI